MPKVSVVVPVYGVEKYIERCATSLFEQTLDDIEYIFVDDCTPDRSMDILNEIIKKFRPRFAREKKTSRIVRMPTNSGLAAVRRQGIQFCTGEYIIHCDSDDWVEPDMYKLMYDEAKRIDADIVMCGFRTTDGINVKSECFHTHTDKDEIIHSMLTMKESWSTCNKLCKKSLLHVDDLIYPQYAMGEDMVLIMQLVLNANKFGIVNRALYNYYRNPNSITRTSSETQIRYRTESIANLNILLSVFDKKDLSKKYEKDLVYTKLFQKWMLLAHLFIRKKYSTEWKSVYPEIDKKVWHLSTIPLGVRLKYYIVISFLWVQDIFNRSFGRIWNKKHL